MRFRARIAILALKAAVMFKCAQFICSGLTRCFNGGRIPAVCQSSGIHSTSIVGRAFCSMFFDNSRSYRDTSQVLADLDLLTVSTSDLQEMLQADRLTSVDLVNIYLDQIESHNHRGMNLNAIITVLERTDALKQARQRDEERSEGRNLGPLHGIPVLVKDLFLSPSLGMETSCGSLALRGAKAIQDAGSVSRLVKAGMIVIGKTNLSEWAGGKGSFLTGGWSAIGGQTQSPYVRGGVLKNATFLGHSTPGGSSSGSAVGVASGFSPVAIGSETDGSIVQPATRAALYAMKPTVGSTDTSYCMGFSPPFDAIGGFAKTVRDLTDLLEVLTDKKLHLKSSELWRDIRIGFVDPTLWQPTEIAVEPNVEFTKQTFVAMDAAVIKLKQHGAKVKRNVPLVTLQELTEDPRGVQAIEELMVNDLEVTMNTFLKHFTGHPIKTLRDVIEFNERHSNRELPPDHPRQDLLQEALANKMTPAEYTRKLKLLRDKAIASIERTLDDYKVDVILGPGDARLSAIAACAGYPVAAVPLGFAEFNGRAFGMHMIASAGQEAKMLRVMSGWETLFPEARAAPPMLATWNKS